MPRFITLTGGQTRTPVRVAVDYITFYDSDKVGSTVLVIGAGPMHFLETPEEIDKKIEAVTTFKLH